MPSYFGIYEFKKTGSIVKAVLDTSDNMTLRDHSQLAETNRLSAVTQFPLLRRFSIASLVAMLVTATILVFLYRQDQLAEHEQISAQRNEQAATQLVHLLDDRINTLATTDDGLNAQALRNNPNLDLFPSAAEMLRSYDILKLKIYNRSGTTIYSSFKGEVGEVGRHPDLLAKALAGETTDRLEFYDTFSGANGTVRDVYVANTYMPLVYAGKHIGAIEIYRDSTPVFAHLNANSIRIPLVIFGGFALLYAALFFYVRRTDRAVAEWQKASLESEKRLRMFEQQKLVQTSLDGFFVVRVEDARIIEVNDAFCGMVGYLREELLTMYISDLEANEAPAETAAHIRKVMEIGYDRFETRHRHKQGHPVDLELSVSHSELDGGINFVFARDISERKGMVEAVIAREQEFRTLAENMPDVLIRYDCEGRRTYVNPALIRNYAVRAELMIGLMQQESNPFDMPETYRLALKHTLATGERNELELQIPTASGDMRTNLVLIAAEREADGQISGAITLAHDITERKRAEALLVQREREFRSLAENLPDNIVRYNREGVTVYVNPVLERTLGEAAAAMIGTTVREYRPDGSYEDYAQLLDAVLASGEAGKLEKIVPGPDGNVSIHQIRMVPERGENGEVVGVLAIGRDITERKQAEKKLRESESRFRTLFESATDCMLILDMDGRIVDVNHAGYERLGYAKLEMLGRKIAEFDTPEYASLVEAHMAKIAEVGNSIFESAHLCKDGTVMPVEINTRVIQLDGEQRYFSVIRDITERKYAERQLRKLTAHIQTVREEEKSHLAREIHDDLGSTLAALKIEAHQLYLGLSAEQKATPRFARVESMVDLLDDALATTRRIITDLRPPQLDDLGLLAALKWHATQFHARSAIECRINCSRGEDCESCVECAGKLDETVSITLFRIFQESLTNVTRHSGASRVAVEFQLGDSEVVLSISDNGRGLPQGHTVASTSYGIRGMRERAEQLGGKINFDSQPGNGFSVMVKLPLSANVQ